MERNHICKKCGGIAGWDSYFQSWICTRCGNEEPKPVTNADRIRAMNDEKLAELMEDKGDCPPIECPHDGEGAKVTRLDCMACWLDWLKQEADDDSN